MGLDEIGEGIQYLEKMMGGPEEAVDLRLYKFRISFEKGYNALKARERNDFQLNQL